MKTRCSSYLEDELTSAFGLPVGHRWKVSAPDELGCRTATPVPADGSRPSHTEGPVVIGPTGSLWKFAPLTENDDVELLVESQPPVRFTRADAFERAGELARPLLRRTRSYDDYPRSA